MNEQIRSLAEQARLSAALLLHHWGTVDALTDSEQNELEQIEKFAELIVFDILNELTNDDTLGPARIETIRKLAERFVVAK